MKFARKADFNWEFDVSSRDLWNVLADTARFNEAAGFPKHQIEEIPRDDGSVQYIATARFSPLTIRWDDYPQNWVDRRWFRHYRRFHTGPMRSLCATYRVKDEGALSQSRYTVEVAPANFVGELILRLGFFSIVERKFKRLADQAAEYCRGGRSMEFDFKKPKLVPGARARVRKLVAEIESSPYGHGLAERLVEYATTQPEVDVWSIRPLKLARLWGVPSRKTVELCLQAAKTGLLGMRWDLLCPRCQIGKLTVASLKELPKGAHCGSCNIDFTQDFSNNVELAFLPSHSIRRLSAGEYCLMGPITTPHIKAQITLQPGESRTEAIDLEPGSYRARTLEPGSEVSLELAGETLPAIYLTDRAVKVDDGDRSPELRVQNKSERVLTFVLESVAWRADALTARKATTLQAFRDLFNDETLRPGDDVKIDSITIMFTDLKGSTALYDRIGDPRAYALVREHFVILGEVVRKHDGSIVKMIGDAIMAVFDNPVDGLDCALEIHREMDRYNRGSGKDPLIIKVGLHTGRCISVTLNDKLDYYGSAANMAARLQGQSVGGDIVLSETFVEDPSVQQRLEQLPSIREHAPLKGFEQPVPFVRIPPDHGSHVETP